MSSRKRLGGVIHTYQKFDPKNLPSPTQPPPDLVSPAFEHLMMFGDMRELTDEELARAVKLDPSQIAGFGPSIDALRAMLEERKRKILEKYETKKVVQDAADRYFRQGKSMKPPGRLAKRFAQSFRDEQIRELERLWYQTGDDRSRFARQLVQLADLLGDKYQVEELAGKYEFTGHTPMTVPEALEIKDELETIDRLLKQLEEAQENAQIGVIDLEELAEFTEPGEVEKLNQLQRQVEEIMRQMAEQQGLERGPKGYELTPKAYRLFQGRLLEKIFANLEASRTGRHQGPVVGEGAVEMQRTKPYEFGDSIANMDMPGSLVNAMVRSGGGLPVKLKQEDIEIHRTRNTPKCATAVLMDMSGSMRYGGIYVHVKRMALALEGLIRREYPGDFLQFIEMYSFAKPVRAPDIARLMPKPVTIFEPTVNLRADMSREDISEYYVPPHFTNIQHALQMGRQFLSAQDTPNRQIILITDGLPTAHFDGPHLRLIYPPHPLTEEATLTEGLRCHREGITINIFLLPSWSQSSEDVQFAYRLAESTQGRVFFTAGRDLDRYVVWDYLNRHREIVA
ncbi:MAG: hypothetical protein DWQ37_02310 [Planctomycetota bacterium]|nr:MAG: hypothetical protein DWQ37_02310 [Planctomycetota bacterium]